MENAPIWMLLTITLAAQTIQTLLRRVYCNRVSNTNSGYNILNAVLSAVCALALAACNEFNLPCSNYTLISAIIFGIITALGCVFSLVATGIGPLSYTTVIISSSTVITALSGCIFWHEQIKITQIIGIALMIVCLICSVKKDDSKTKTSLKWLFMCLIAMLFTGGVGIMQKIHQSSEHASELYAFLVIAFEISTVASLITLAFSIRRDKGRVFVNNSGSALKIWLTTAIVGVISGICVAACNAINLFLSGKMPSAVLFPILNGGSLVIVVVASMILFREKLSLKQWIGIILGAIAVLLLCL